LKKITILIIAMVLVYATDILAQSTIIRKIEIVGSKTVKEENIRDLIKTRPGDDFSSSKLREDLKSIYKMGSFSDVSIEAEECTDGLKIIFNLKEKMGTGEIKFTGNKSIWSSTIQEALDIHKGDTCSFDTLSLTRNKMKILNLYKDKGYPTASIDAKIEVKKELANITFLIKEGNRVDIKKIYFKGNKAFPSKILMKKMEIGIGKRYNEKALESGLEKLADFYRDEGYILISILSHKTSFDDERKKAFIDVVLNEGPQIKIRRIQVRGNTVFSAADIQEKMFTKEGRVFNQSKFIEDLRFLQSRYYERGYILTRVMPLTDIDEDSGTISIVLEISEEELIYIEEIKIEGNIATKDKIIRRELTVKRGEVFNTQKIWRSRQKIYNLGFFEEVDITTEPGNEKGKMFLVVKVKEKRTGMMSFGAGYNSIDGFLGYLELSQNNFRGLGEFLSGKVEIGPKKLNFEISFTEPWLLDTPTSLGFSLYHTTRDRIEYYYKEKRIGGNLTVGRAISDFDKIYLGYKYESVEIFDVGENATSDVKSQKGINATSSMSLSYARDTRDNRFDASSGIYLNLSTEVAGGILGGNYHFYRPILDVSNYYKLFFKWLVLGLHLRAGMIDSYLPSTEVPVYEKFYAGGADTIRGYPERSLPSGATGGKAILYGNTEIRFPIPGTQNMLKGIIFYDIGNAWKELEVNFDQLKKGVGFGIRINLPVGALRFDMGYGIDRRVWEPHFSIGQMF